MPKIKKTKTKATKRRTWTLGDLRMLRKLAKKKTPAAKIARELKRTEGATRQKAFDIEVSLDSRPKLKKAA